MNDSVDHEPGDRVLVESEQFRKDRGVVLAQSRAPPRLCRGRGELRTCVFEGHAAQVCVLDRHEMPAGRQMRILEGVMAVENAMSR